MAGRLIDTPTKGFPKALKIFQYKRKETKRKKSQKKFVCTIK